MGGTPARDAPGSFWTAPVDEAARRLAAVLDEENADVLTVYDDNGGYGHPDHIQVHRVGLRAAELAGPPRVYQNTMNRGHFLRGRALLAENAPDMPDIENSDAFGKPEEGLRAGL